MGELLIEHLLKPSHEGRMPIDYRPPGWVRLDRRGSISIPASTTGVLVEGVGVACRAVRPWLDAVLWVHARDRLARARLVAKGDTDAFIDEWMREENAFLGEHRPWEVADMVVAGKLGQPSPNGRYGNVVTAPGPRQTKQEPTDDDREY